MWRLSLTVILLESLDQLLLHEGYLSILQLDNGLMRTVIPIIQGKARTAKLSVGSGINFLSSEAQNKNSSQHHDWVVLGFPVGLVPKIVTSLISGQLVMNLS
jgi:hypothetical protein